jgi:hypothetical protein
MQPMKAAKISLFAQTEGGEGNGHKTKELRFPQGGRTGIPKYLHLRSNIIPPHASAAAFL